MPTFDFICQDCNHEFETRIPFGQPIKTDCPKCDSLRTEKQFTPPGGIIFKGSGFYKNDARNSGAAKKISKPKKPESAKVDESTSDAVPPASDTNH